MTGDSYTPEARQLVIRTEGESADALCRVFAASVAGTVSQEVIRLATEHLAKICAPAAARGLPFGCAVALPKGARFRFSNGASVLPAAARSGFVIQTERDIALDDANPLVLIAQETVHAGAGFGHEPAVTVLAFARDVAHPFHHCASVNWGADARMLSEWAVRVPRRDPSLEVLLALLTGAAAATA